MPDDLRGSTGGRGLTDLRRIVWCGFGLGSRAGFGEYARDLITTLTLEVEGPLVYVCPTLP